MKQYIYLNTIGYQQYLPLVEWCITVNISYGLISTQTSMKLLSNINDVIESITQ